jgi:hypothetical protein
MRLSGISKSPDSPPVSPPPLRSARSVCGVCVWVGVYLDPLAREGWGKEHAGMAVPGCWAPVLSNGPQRLKPHPNGAVECIQSGTNKEEPDCHYQQQQHSSSSRPYGQMFIRTCKGAQSPSSTVTYAYKYYQRDTILTNLRNLIGSRQQVRLERLMLRSGAPTPVESSGVILALALAARSDCGLSDSTPQSTTLYAGSRQGKALLILIPPRHKVSHKGEK